MSHMSSNIIFWIIFSLPDNYKCTLGPNVKFSTENHNLTSGKYTLLPVQPPFSIFGYNFEFLWF